MAKVFFQFQVSLKDRYFMFHREAPALPTGVCWYLGMVVNLDDSDSADDDTKIDFIRVKQSGDVIIYTEDDEITLLDRTFDEMMASDDVDSKYLRTFFDGTWTIVRDEQISWSNNYAKQFLHTS